MQTTKPKIQRLHITVRDPDAGRSKHVTLYSGTIDEAIQRLTSNAVTTPTATRTPPPTRRPLTQ